MSPSNHHMRLSELEAIDTARALLSATLGWSETVDNDIGSANNVYWQHPELSVWVCVEPASPQHVARFSCWLGDECFETIWGLITWVQMAVSFASGRAEYARSER